MRFLKARDEDIVILEFSSYEGASAWYRSPAYQPQQVGVW
jgi:uncharacterized protein (DUF1330 family)